MLFTGGSIKYPTRHQCIQDNGSQQPLGVRTLYFDIINNELRVKNFQIFFKNSKNLTVMISNLNDVTVKKYFSFLNILHVSDTLDRSQIDSGSVHNSQNILTPCSY